MIFSANTSQTLTCRGSHLVFDWLHFVFVCIGAASFFVNNHDLGKTGFKWACRRQVWYWLLRRNLVTWFNLLANGMTIHSDDRNNQLGCLRNVTKMSENVGRETTQKISYIWCNTWLWCKHKRSKCTTWLGPETAKMVKIQFWNFMKMSHGFAPF